ncbi:MAG: type II 3-dehydroquinate dehydratase [Clostridia bacterium]|nr:type II 3-dehydroquinate dehydratase [Clostridia bacterium]MBQ3554092.1 type II 3-dehydroquinate dehydratase [Clostridia bacterium]
MFHKIMLLNGPNLNMLGIRQPEIYGRTTLADIESRFTEKAKALGFSAECVQSNSEGALIDAIQSCYGRIDGIVLNAGAYTHYSYAIRDAIASVSLPVMEVHLSDIHAREEFRHISVIEPVCKKQICGLGEDGYYIALEELIRDYVD